ncbi:MAG TPA: T9SS type A sorting domain-containing protein, partial [Ferruginibacter sp.]|nr:T9SS type A sorting domain-containing protein [Ferruginibacter sp.]
YEWTIPGNASIVSGQGTNSISVLYQNGFTSGSIMVASVSPCGNSSARSLSVAATKPGTPTVITGPTQVCPFINQATNAFYTIDPVANATSYQWTAPANATIVSGQGSLTVEISFAAGFTSGNLSVRAAANCGISSARSLALTRSVARPGAITASASPCPNTTVTYSIDPVPNATGYQWALPSNAIYVSGQGTTSYTVTFKSTFTTGQVAVKALNACSSSANTTLALDATICSQVQKGMIAAENKATLIYPNPAHQSFRLAYTATQSNENIRLSVIDRLGNTVKQESVRSVTAGRNQITVWIGNLPSGVYEVRLVRNGSVETSKLVVSE